MASVSEELSEDMLKESKDYAEFLLKYMYHFMTSVEIDGDTVYISVEKDGNKKLFQIKGANIDSQKKQVL